LLTDLQIRRAKPRVKSYRLTDAQALVIMITPAGGKVWQYRYRIAGKAKTLSLGGWPEIGLAEARAARDHARKLLREGKDPGVEKKVTKLAARVARTNTFEAVALEWHKLQSETWSAKHAQDVLDTLARDLFPKIGKLPVHEVTGPVLLSAIRPIETRGARETAHRVRQRAEAIFDFAKALGFANDNPARPMVAALKPIIRGRQPAVTKLEDARKVLAAAEATQSRAITLLALRFLALTVVRPGELRSALWTDFPKGSNHPAEWFIPAERMKMKREHIVTLSRQAIEVIEVLRPLTGRGIYLFPSARSFMKPMSANAIGYLINRAGFHQRHVPHGWRATFSTVMNERFKEDRQIIDLMLAHSKKDKTEAAYNRALHLERRAELSQIWADLLLADAPPAAELARSI